MLGMITVRQGERVAVWNRRGELRLVDGPRELFGWGRTVEPLARYSAGPDEYLAIESHSGAKQHVRGPASIWFHPTEHKSISVEKAVPLDANEALVVYSQASGRVERRIERGPALFVPTADEWLHHFAWHGANPRRERVKVPRGLQFTRLRVIPDQMYFDVVDVRTADDALLVVKLMIFFELVDIERMLDQTHDPVADFINAVSADTIDFAAAHSFDSFKEHTAALNDLATYRQLTARAERIGYRINKVVYRGYHASDALQGMHDHAIEARTQLRLSAETERQAQDLEDLKLASEEQRATRRHGMEAADVEHQNRLRAARHEERLRRDAAAGNAQRSARQLDRQAELDQRRSAHCEHLEYLHGLHAMKIDLTQVLVARARSPDKLIQIDGAPARLHVHESA